MTTSHLKSLLAGGDAAEKPTTTKAARPAHQPVVVATTSETQVEHTNTTDKDSAAAVASTSQSKPSDHMLASGPRKRSILLNMMLPPEPLAVDAKLALPPVILFPPVLEPEGGSITIQDRGMDVTETVAASSTSETTSNSTSWSLRSWAWGGNSGTGQVTKRTRGHGKQQQYEGGAKKEGIVETVNVVESKTTTTVSKTTQVRTWISRIGGSRAETDGGKQVAIPHTSLTTGAESTTTIVPGGLVQQLSPQQQVQQQHQQQLTTIQGIAAATSTSSSQSQVQVDQNGNVMAMHQQRQEIIHQEIHQKTRSVALVNVNVSVSDVFGIGKVMEVVLALFHAHGAFLRRNPFWLQCVLMGWEMLVVLLLVWGVLRVVGLAEVVVWGADDLIRGTLSTVQMVGRTLQSYLTPY